MEQFKQEIKEKKRFQFGKNWKSFLRNLDDQKIENSKISLLNFLELSNLNGKIFLDVGSGSGLSSLSAKNSGAKVFSFDFDTQSVECTKFIKDKYFNGKSEDWVVEQGSALDENYLNSLPKFDIVYSWGVLHQTLVRNVFLFRSKIS
jgi:2-polyprenyl-3-methyl-5-hydroxy-6-metoxy-1,4-benzoquinol methylase